MSPGIAALGAILLVVALGIAIHATLIAPFQLNATRFDASIPGLGTAFDGYTLVVLADIHHGTARQTRQLRRMVELTNAASADLIILLGDYGASFHHNRPLSAALYERSFPALGFTLRQLHARDGTVAVLGNHDHYYDASRVASWLRSVGARVLINDHFVIRRGADQLVIGGVDDALEGRVDPMGGAGDRSGEAPLIVLSHNPDGVLSLSRESGACLVLSGHTHGGQVVLPLYGAPVTFTRICGRRSASGWIPNATAPLYVSRGVGAQWPIRFRCPPEVLIIRLRVGDDQQPA